MHYLQRLAVLAVFIIMLGHGNARPQRIVTVTEIVTITPLPLMPKTTASHPLHNSSTTRRQSVSVSPSLPLSTGAYNQPRPTSSAPAIYTNGTWNVTGPQNTSTPRNESMPHPIRGVNIGGWLVLEKWMNSDVFEGTSATDQYTFDQTPGAEAALQKHWSTFFTEADVAQIASYGLNAMRIPIGYWAFNNTGTPYITGADAYLEKAIQWARKYGLKVMVDCHGSPGSQNGFDNSGQAGQVKWQSDGNLKNSIDVLETMAYKYGSMEFADVVMGIELVNEPISWGQNNFTLTQQWAQEAYAVVKSAATNDNLLIIMHDSFQGPSAWESVGAKLNGANATLSTARFAVDVHLYQNQVPADSQLTQAQHISKVCTDWTATELLPANSTLPVLVGEFSAATNICANPDGSTVAGSVCTTEGCQCSSNVPFEDWKQPLLDATRMFFEAQMEVFETRAQGWFVWSYKDVDGGAWSLQNIMQSMYGMNGTVAERKWPNVCGFTTSGR